MLYIEHSGVSVYLPRVRKPSCIPFIERSTSSISGSGSSPAGRSSKCRRTFEMVLFISSIANFWPIQLREPALNGMYAYGLLSMLLDRRKRSGRNVSGSENTTGSRNIINKFMVKLQLAGMVKRSSAKGKYIKMRKKS